MNMESIPLKEDLNSINSTNINIPYNWNQSKYTRYSHILFTIMGIFILIITLGLIILYISGVLE